ncbi:ABC-F family ATP-binding cassette domain-containing protein [Bacillus paralicheniformis]|uniref:ABC-F family ATP-binding cassette domain-containing protein n=1 Tax=Bacillus paralicheniformis TaxID=1648923 RepID=UPI000652949D|nr:ABC-F family ATP-binding cassette domain-containing protein [Bacillus paralicheniformis]KRT91571.1 ABC transporter ATP-binding protein [Bacillus paralicheniformis]
MSIVHVTNLTHIYGDRIIFQDAGFRLLKGEHAGLVGANGAGKSTLLRILTGSLLPDHGNIEWQPNIRAGFLEQHAKLTKGTTILQYMEQAYDRLFEIEKQLNRLAEKMADAEDNLEAILKRYGELQSELESSGFYQIGTKPDVLLLDEPTNYLDAAHIEWLTGYLKNYKHAFLVISHDEHFLNEITTVTFHLEHQTIKRYSGSYQYFLKEYVQSRAQAEAAYAKQHREIKKLEGFIDRNRVRKAKQAKSREKALSKIKRIEKPTDSYVPSFSFKTGRNPAMTVLKTENLEAGYTVPLFKPLSLTVKRGDKIAITGENGAGKSTLIKTLLGDLKPLSGTVTAGQHLQAAYFRQESPASHHTPLEKLRAFFPDLSEKDIRQTLAISGLTPKHISQPLATLSGGEQAKVRLAELMLSNSNLLVLDEPTNHLDTSAKRALKQALCDYKGTILLVSHEPSFYEDWVTHIWRIEAWRRK